MSEFKKYRRKKLAELRSVTQEEIDFFKIEHYIPTNNDYDVSISDADVSNGSPKLGDMVARNPKNHNDQWLVAKKYFEDNFEEI